MTFLLGMQGTWRGTTVAVKMQRMDSVDLDGSSTNSAGQSGCSTEIYHEAQTMKSYEKI